MSLKGVPKYVEARCKECGHLFRVPKSLVETGRLDGHCCGGCGRPLWKKKTYAERKADADSQSS